MTVAVLNVTIEGSRLSAEGDERRRTDRLVARWFAARADGPPPVRALGAEAAAGCFIDPAADPPATAPDGSAPSPLASARFHDMARVAAALGEPVGVEGWEADGGGCFFRAALLPVIDDEGARRVLVVVGAAAFGGQSTPSS